MSSFTRTIQRSSVRDLHHIGLFSMPPEFRTGRGSKLGVHNDDLPVGHQKRTDRAPRGSRRGINKLRGPFGKAGQA